MEWKRLENESDEELIYRICLAKEQIGTWEDVADVLNTLLNTEYTSSKFRKQFQAFEKMLKANENTKEKNTLEFVTTKEKKSLFHNQ